MTRRDRCHLVGVRAARLSGIQAAWAWSVLSGMVEAMGERDLPKFKDVLSAIRVATIEGARIGGEAAPAAGSALSTLNPQPSTFPE